MLLIGCARSKALAEKLDGYESDGVRFEVVSTQGLQVTVRHTAADDQSAKKMVKELVKTLPELKQVYVNIQLIDESGRIL